MRFFFTSLLVILAGLSTAQYRHGEPPVVSGGNTLALDWTDSTMVRVESDPSLTLRKVASSAFIPLRSLEYSRKIPRKLCQHVFYLRFPVSNSGSDTLKRIFYPGMYFRELALYELSEKNEPHLTSNGTEPGYVRLAVPPGTRKEFLLKMVFFRHDNNLISARLISPDHLATFLKQLSTYAYTRKMVGFVIGGALLMMVLFNLLNGLSSRRAEFLYNGLYSVCMFIIITGFAQYYNSPGKANGQFLSFWWLILLNVGYIFYIQFSRKFLNTASQHRLLDLVFKIEMLLILVLMCSYAIARSLTNNALLDSYIETAMKAIVVVVSFIYVILGMENKQRLMNYLALGSAVQAACAIVALALASKSADTPRLFTSSFFYFEIGVVGSQVFFLLGLAYKNRTELIDEIKYREAIRLNEEKAAYEKRLAIVEARQVERNRISADMHDDLGAGMTTIRLYSELAKRKIGNNPIPEIDKISHAANELLVKMNAIIWSMSDSNDTLGNMVAYIRSYALEFFENTGIRCQVHIPENLPKLVVVGEVRRNVFLIVKEALNNILKHAEATEVRIILTKEKEGLSLQIMDNGKGIDFDKLRRFGNGLQNMKKRMDEIGGEFSIMNHEGTCIRLYAKTRT